MRRTLEQVILADGRVTPDEVRDARRSMQFFGGSLLTNLVRLEVVGEDDAGDMLAAWLGLPYVPWRTLKNAPAEALALLDGTTAGKRRVVPFQLDEAGLHVATGRPDNDVFFGELSRRIGRPVQAHAALEDRVDLALQRHYGLRPQARSAVRPALQDTSRDEDLESVPGSFAARTSRAEGGKGTGLGLDGLPLDSDATAEMLNTSGVNILFDNPAEADASAASMHAVSGLDLPERLRELAGAANRLTLGEAALEIARGIGAGRALLFALQKERLTPWAASGDDVDVSRIPSAGLPATGTSILAGAAQSTEAVVGPLPVPPHGELCAALGGTPPGLGLAVPIRLRDRTVGVLYVDGGSGSTAAPSTPVFNDLAGKMALALEILLLRRKILS